MSKDYYYQQKSSKPTKNNMDNVSSYHCQTQFNNNQNPINLFPSRNSQIQVINPSQKKKKIIKSSLPFQNYNNNKRSKSLNILTKPNLSYASKNEVPAGLPHPLLKQRQNDYQQSSHDQSQFRRLSFETSSCFCCKSSSTNSDDYFAIKLPGMLQFIPVPKCTIENNDQQFHVFSPPKINIDHQSIRVKLPGIQNNSIFLCEEPWWLETTVPSSQIIVEQQQKEVEEEEEEVIVEEIVIKEKKEEEKTLLIKDQEVMIKEEKNLLLLEEEKILVQEQQDVMLVKEQVDVNEEYESVRAIDIQSDVKPIIKIPFWIYSSNTFKFDQKKEDIMYVEEFCHVTTSNSIEFVKESPIVQLCPKQTISQITSNPRSNLPNLKIETNLKLDKDDEEGFFRSAGGSTLSTPISEISSTSFSNMSTYAESENTVFTEEEIIIETKSCNAPERRSPSVLSDFSSEQLTPVLEVEEEDESKMSSSTSISTIEYQEECQEKLTLEEESLESEEILETSYNNESENESSDDDPKDDDNIQREYVLPELRKIAEQLENSQSDSKETIRIRRQLEIIGRDNYPDSLPLSNKWTMYFADTSVTKTNTRIISKNKYSSTLNPIFKCTTVPELCSNLREFSSKIKPSDMKTNVNLSFFKGDIMPMWEDEANCKGGRFTLCPQRHLLNSLWDSIVLLLAGETIDDNNFICGAVCARRDRGDRVELWISGDAYQKAIDHIRDLLAEELSNFDTVVRNLKYKRHIGKP
ncbi:hypothetical protein C1645_834913 [Glomus cerebriforme]|uniref:Translation initiation factor eIF 4e-like domain-containing protein n=1 Tax=Glomus cerebriforme TaxID=658196 RepID=A0A397SCZ0_9GLOM|nr:hypothetical protein C1645_834913 [Glomus cerebriforme]